MSKDPLYDVAEKALRVYLDANRKAVGSPDETPVGWYWLNSLGDELIKIFPYHPELQMRHSLREEEMKDE